MTFIYFCIYKYISTTVFSNFNYPGASFKARAITLDISIVLRRTQTKGLFSRFSCLMMQQSNYSQIKLCRFFYTEYNLIAGETRKKTIIKIINFDNNSPVKSICKLCQFLSFLYFKFWNDLQL